MYKILSWAAVIAWMALIFYFSHQPGSESSELSQGVTEIIVTTVEKIAPNADYDINHFHYLVRKNAHFFVYLVLGMLVINALRRSGVKGGRSIALAFFVCVLYAISDEVHQLFIPGRSGEVTDVIIDSAGSSVGIVVYLLIGKVVKKSRE